MKIVIPGGSGQIGTVLTRSFLGLGHEVVILGRQAAPTQGRLVAWDGETLGAWASEIEGSDVVINLAGRSVNCRYHARHQREILDSRLKSTAILGEAIARASEPPRLWLQSSTATIYAHRYDAGNDEATGILGGTEADRDVPKTWKFSTDVARAWEKAAEDAKTPKTRKVLLRSAMTMSPDRGGIFDVLIGLTRLGLAGTNGDGRQYVSWIHEADFVQALLWLIEHEDLEGPVNLASPNPLPNRDFMRILRQAWGAKIGLPATRWMLEIGAFLMRTETELLLKSRRVIPGKLVESGFSFQFATWEAAAADLCRRWKDAHRRPKAELSA